MTGYMVKQAGKILLSCLLLLAVIHPSSAQKPAWTIYTDNIPPLTFVNEQGELDGSAYKHIKSALDDADIPFQLVQRPWSRSLQLYQADNRSFIYPITRTSNREAQYQWLLPLYSHSHNLYALKSRVQNPEADIDVTTNRFLCIDNAIGCDFLRENGIPESSIVTISSINVEQIITMLLKERVEFALGFEKEFQFQLEQLGHQMDEFVVIPKYSRHIVDYLVTHPSHKSAEIERLKKNQN